MNHDGVHQTPLGPVADEQLARLLELRRRLVDEQRNALTPAVARALEMADMQLFLALSYVGYTHELFPGELVQAGDGDPGPGA